MRIKLASLIIFILNSLIISSGATELGGIKILQSSDNFIKNDDNEKRNRKYDENVKIYLNNSFNLSYKKIETLTKLIFYTAWELSNAPNKPVVDKLNTFD